MWRFWLQMSISIDITLILSTEHLLLTHNRILSTRPSYFFQKSNTFYKVNSSLVIEIAHMVRHCVSTVLAAVLEIRARIYSQINWDKSGYFRINWVNLSDFAFEGYDLFTRRSETG